MITIRMNDGNNVIGRIGENEAVRLAFDITGWKTEYPQGSMTVICKRPNDADGYPVNNSQITIDDNTLYWVLSSGDLAQKGSGQCELILTNGNTIAKSAIYSIIIREALDGSGTVPEPWESWVQQVADDADRAEAAATSASEYAATAESIATHYGLNATQISGSNYRLEFNGGGN
jgi:hypothetical protein